MSNVPSISLSTDEMISQLQQATARLPVTQIMSELQTIVERISFAGLHHHHPQASPEALAELDLLLNDEVSDDFMNYVHWLASKEALEVLADQTGHIFLNYCVKFYKQVSEVRFITAVELSNDFRQVVAHTLATVYPPPARIVYEVMPSIAAGFVIQADGTTVDKSLRSYMVDSIKLHLGSLWKREARP